MMDREIRIVTEQNINSALMKAIGYLSTWAQSSYNKVGIFDDRTFNSKHNLIACYHNTENGSNYTIGAIYDEEKGEYSFHS